MTTQLLEEYNAFLISSTVSALSLGFMIIKWMPGILRHEFYSTILGGVMLTFFLCGFYGTVEKSQLTFTQTLPENSSSVCYSGMATLGFYMVLGWTCCISHITCCSISLPKDELIHRKSSYVKAGLIIPIAATLILYYATNGYDFLAAVKIGMGSILLTPDAKMHALILKYIPAMAVTVYSFVILFTALDLESHRDIDERVENLNKFKIVPLLLVVFMGPLVINGIVMLLGTDFNASLGYYECLLTNLSYGPFFGYALQLSFREEDQYRVLPVLGLELPLLNKYPTYEDNPRSQILNRSKSPLVLSEELQSLRNSALPRQNSKNSDKKSEVVPRLNMSLLASNRGSEIELPVLSHANSDTGRKESTPRENNEHMHRRSLNLASEHRRKLSGQGSGYKPPRLSSPQKTPRLQDSLALNSIEEERLSIHSRNSIKGAKLSINTNARVKTDPLEKTPEKHEKRSSASQKQSSIEILEAKSHSTDKEKNKLNNSEEKITSDEEQKMGDYQFLNIDNLEDNSYKIPSVNSLNGISTPLTSRSRKFVRDISEVKQQLVREVSQEGLTDCELILGIDCTASNQHTGKNSFGKRCLHEITKGRLNFYEQAISVMGSIIEDLSSDDRFPVYLFGDALTKDQTVRPLYVDDDGVEACFGVEHILSEYRRVIPEVELAGPTSFKPLIERAIELYNKERRFVLLLIIGDGAASDIEQSAKAIVEASKYPLYIVMVGVGDGDVMLRPTDPWCEMLKLESELPGRNFDNFTFVLFKNGMSAEELAKKMFAEIPAAYKYCKEQGILQS